jgi:hypothetical protein
MSGETLVCSNNQEANFCTMGPVDQPQVSQSSSEVNYTPNPNHPDNAAKTYYTHAEPQANSSKAERQFTQAVAAKLARTPGQKEVPYKLYRSKCDSYEELCNTLWCSEITDKTKEEFAEVIAKSKDAFPHVPGVGCGGPNVLEACTNNEFDPKVDLNKVALNECCPKSSDCKSADDPRTLVGFDIPKAAINVGPGDHPQIAVEPIIAGASCPPQAPNESFMANPNNINNQGLMGFNMNLIPLNLDKTQITLCLYGINGRNDALLSSCQTFLGSVTRSIQQPPLACK